MVRRRHLGCHQHVLDREPSEQQATQAFPPLPAELVLNILTIAALTPSFAGSVHSYLLLSHAIRLYILNALLDSVCIRSPAALDSFELFLASHPDAGQRVRRLWIGNLQTLGAGQYSFFASRIRDYILPHLPRLRSIFISNLASLRLDIFSSAIWTHRECNLVPPIWAKLRTLTLANVRSSARFLHLCPLDGLWLQFPELEKLRLILPDELNTERLERLQRLPRLQILELIEPWPVSIGAASITTQHITLHLFRSSLIRKVLPPLTVRIVTADPASFSVYQQHWNSLSFAKHCHTHPTYPPRLEIVKLDNLASPTWTTLWGHEHQIALALWGFQRWSQD